MPPKYGNKFSANCSLDCRDSSVFILSSDFLKWSTRSIIHSYSNDAFHFAIYINQMMQQQFFRI
jgi:hypothetical protein